MAVVNSNWMEALALSAEEYEAFFPHDNFATYVADGIRPPEGRPLGGVRDTSLQLGMITTAEGSALAKVGQTTMLAAAKLEVMKPEESAADCGKITVSFEMPPVCGPEARPGPQTEAVHAVQQQVSGILTSSGFVDAHQLCIAPGKAAWMIYLDVYCLSADGSPLDAALLAATAALASVRLPSVAVTDEGVVVPASAEGGEAVIVPGVAKPKRSKKSKEGAGGEARLASAGGALGLGPLPVALTTGLWGKHLIVDPTAQEEKLMEGMVTVALGSQEELLAVYKPGGGRPASIRDLQFCIEATKLRYKEVQLLFSKAMDTFSMEEAS